MLSHVVRPTDKKKWVHVVCPKCKGEQLGVPGSACWKCGSQPQGVLEALPLEQYVKRLTDLGL